MPTLNELKKEVDALVEAGHGKLPLMYSIDDEGNGYNKVNNLPGLCEVTSMEDLEPIGYYNGDPDDPDNIKPEDANYIIIN